MRLRAAGRRLHTRARSGQEGLETAHLRGSGSGGPSAETWEGWRRGLKQSLPVPRCRLPRAWPHCPAGAHPSWFPTPPGGSPGAGPWPSAVLGDSALPSSFPSVHPVTVEHLLCVRRCEGRGRGADSHLLPAAWTAGPRTQPAARTAEGRGHPPRPASSTCSQFLPPAPAGLALLITSASLQSLAPGSPAGGSRAPSLPEGQAPSPTSLQPPGSPHSPAQLSPGTWGGRGLVQPPPHQGEASSLAQSATLLGIRGTDPAGRSPQAISCPPSGHWIKGPSEVR